MTIKGSDTDKVAYELSRLRVTEGWNIVTEALRQDVLDLQANILKLPKKRPITQEELARYGAKILADIELCNMYKAMIDLPGNLIKKIDSSVVEGDIDLDPY